MPGVSFSVAPLWVGWIHPLLVAVAYNFKIGTGQRKVTLEQPPLVNCNLLGQRLFIYLVPPNNPFGSIIGRNRITHFASRYTK